MYWQLPTQKLNLSSIRIRSRNRLEVLINSTIALEEVTSVIIVGSIHGPMQCMLKGVCAQCLQWQLKK
ncbi:hypothetical protein [Candidatus Marithrix sp. Canyon 246]|uniref:hypothetical protein n=1 Tax=Candidatus Marithrix sp. Canyon 246 TaxID=1827136 RepID=UPI00084A09C3|nr:hypothetical protein [Candidatus Marithrix sp. Canyon 246]